MPAVNAPPAQLSWTGMASSLPAKRLQRPALAWYALGSLVLALGMSLAAARYPRNFDWAYTVISALASQKHNPDGGAWFAGALAVGMACLWPVVTALVQRTDGRAQGTEAKSGVAIPRWIKLSLRVGVGCGVLVGLERLVFFHFSSQVRKGHELVALIAFLAFYAGVVGLYLHRARQKREFRWSAVIVVVPLLAIGLRELTLYFAQRGIGWADYDWRGHGAPLWLSFAFWQWLAAGLLWLAVGQLLVTNEAPRGAGQ